MLVHALFYLVSNITNLLKPIEPQYVVVDSRYLIIPFILLRTNMIRSSVSYIHNIVIMEFVELYSGDRITHAFVLLVIPSFKRSQKHEKFPSRYDL